MPEVAQGRRGPTASSAPAARTTRTRSTTSLCFPFIFRGALDCGATTINEEMKLAAVRALAELAQAEPSEIVALAYGEPTPRVRPRLPDSEAVRSAPDRQRSRRRWRKAAMDSGVATRPIADFDAYREQLTQFVYHSGTHDAAGVRRGQARAEARRLRRRRGRARAARRAGRRRRRARAPDAARPPRRHRSAHREARPAPDARQATARASTSSTTRATATTGREYYQLARRKGVSRAAGAGGDAQPADADRGDAGAPRRGRRHAVRHLRQLRASTCATSAT